jgi:hypothetical protein
MRLPGLFVALLFVGGSVAVPLERATAHPGGLNAEGCHNNRKTGDYHCHRSGNATRTSGRSYGALSSSSGGAFRNCTAARAAGAAPVRRGDPGYGTHLDRDGDGVGCE